MKRLANGSVDCIICDPPYGITCCEWDKVIPIDEMWAEFDRVLKNDGAAVIFANEPFSSSIIAANKRRFRYKWYWIKSNKTGAPFAKMQPMRQVEEILVFYKKHGTYNPQGLVACERTRDVSRKTSHVYRIRGSIDYIQTHRGYPSNVLQYTKDAHNIHPTQKPLALIEYLIRTYTNEGETVLDPCVGSGTTAVAAVNTGRHYIGYETDNEYYRIAQERVRAVREQIM